MLFINIALLSFLHSHTSLTLYMCKLNSDWGLAIREYEEAVKRNPKEPSYHNNLSATLCKVMDFQGAKREVEKALDLGKLYVLM